MQEKNKFEQQKKEFQSTLSMFSHEIRNPLALITSELQMLSDHHPQLCLDEHWDNIMENLNYIRELSMNFPGTRMQDISLSYQQIQACGLIELPIPFDLHWIIWALYLRLTSLRIFPILNWIRQKSVRLFLIFSAMHRRPFSTHTEKSRLPLLLFQMEYRSPSMTMAVV